MGKPVTAEAQLLGHWRTLELYGRAVSSEVDINSRPLWLDFLQLSGQWTWSASEGCNATAGRFSISARRAFNAFGQSTTLVACPDLPRSGERNIKAPQRADQAWLAPADGGDPARLTLTDGGVTVGVYEALPRR